MMQISPLLNVASNSNTATVAFKPSIFRSPLPLPAKQDTFQRNKQQFLQNSIGTNNVASPTPQVGIRSGILAELMGLGIENYHTSKAVCGKLLNPQELRRFFRTVLGNREDEIFGPEVFETIAGSIKYFDDDVLKFDQYQNVEAHHTDYIKALSKLFCITHNLIRNPANYDHISFTPKYEEMPSNIKTAIKLFREAFNGSTGDRALLRPHYLASEAGANVLYQLKD
jgi:hypothetical protein